MALASGQRAVVPLIRPIIRQRRFSADAISIVNPELHIPVKYGVGRQSVSGITATCFGATGFVGRYVVGKLAACGSNCIIPYRGDGYNTRHLKPMGDLGKVVPLPIDFREEESIRGTMLKSNVVVNMIGANHETRNYSYDDVNVKCVHRLCKMAAEAGGIKRFVHFSALGADINSPSALLRSKAVGEQVVRDYFPHATILRPAPIFGDEDRFLNPLAHMVSLGFIVPELIEGDHLVQPVFVQDVAQAALAACVDQDALGRTFELGGPWVMKRSEVLEWVMKSISKQDETYVMPVPAAICKLMAKALKVVPWQHWRPLTPDAVDQALVSLVVNPKAQGTLRDLGVEPATLDQGGHYAMMNHRSAGEPKLFALRKGDPRREWLYEPTGIPDAVRE